MTDPLMQEYRNLSCPPDSRPEIVIDEDRVGCFTRDGEEVTPLAVPRLGVVGWAAIIAGVLSVGAEAYRRWW